MPRPVSRQHGDPHQCLPRSHGRLPEEQLSVYVTARQYGSLLAEKTYVETIRHLREICEDMLDSHVVEHVLNPLARMISME